MQSTKIFSIFVLSFQIFLCSPAVHAQGIESSRPRAADPQPKTLWTTPTVLAAFFYVGGNQFNGPFPAGWSFSHPSAGVYRFTAPSGVGTGWAWPVISLTNQGLNADGKVATAVIASGNPDVFDVTTGNDSGGLADYGFNLVIFGY